MIKKDHKTNLKLTNNKISNLFIAILIGLLIIFAFSVLYGFIISPRLNKNIVCVQMISRACFLNTPICIDFPNPCSTPPLWYPQKIDFLDF